MGLLLALPEIIGPGITLDIIGAGGVEQTDAPGADQAAWIQIAKSAH